MGTSWAAPGLLLASPVTLSRRQQLVVFLYGFLAPLLAPPGFCWFLVVLSSSLWLLLGFLGAAS